MKVMQISATYLGGGPGNTTAYVHKALEDVGIDSVVCQVLSDVSEKNVFTLMSGRQYLNWKILKKIYLNISQFACIETNKLIHQIKVQKPDIVHVRVIHHGIINYKQLFKFLNKYGKPVVISLHDMWSITGGCYHFVDVNCEQYKTGCRRCPKKRKQLDCFPFETQYHWKCKKQLWDECEKLHVICVSEWVKEQLLQSVLKKTPSSVVTNAVDTALFRPMPRTQWRNKKVVVGVANYWSKVKGIQDFIELSKSLTDEYQIILVGNIPEEFQNAIKEHEIIAMGAVKDRQKLAQIYSDADVFVSLSYQETFGMVIAEAACCGLKTIGYNISAIPEIISKAKGEVVPVADVLAVAEKIRQVCMQETKLTSNELSEVRSSFSMERLVSQHIELYMRLKEDKRP